MLKYFTILLLIANNFCNAQQIFSAKVIGIKDGDTVVVLDSLNIQTTLRLAEVDCPEKNQPFGMKSKQFTSSQIYLRNIKYVITDVDRYGRSIAMIYYDTKYLSAEIIKAGMGWHYKKYSTSIQLSDFELTARKNKVGLWSDANSVEPWLWRRKK